VELPATLTPVTPSAMAAAVPAAYAVRFGQAPDRETAELLLALLFIENDHGRAVIQHNWGNISVFVGPNVDYWRPPWFDLESVEARPDTDPQKARYLELHQQMLEHRAPSAFAAFEDDQAGIVSWLAHVRPTMYDAAATGDPMQFAHAYWASGYCPDQACKDSGPTFEKLQAEIRNAGYFAELEPSKKKAAQSPAVQVNPGGLAAAEALRSSLSPASQSSGTSFSGLFDSKGPVSPMTRNAVVLCAVRELELVQAGYFTSTRVDEYWADVLHQSVRALHPPQWCGAFALFCLHAALLAPELTWRFGSKSDPRSGFLWTLKRTEFPEPGDVGYIDQPHQHHFIVETAEPVAGIVECVDGNAGKADGHEPIKRVDRKWGAPGIVYFSIASLLPQPKEVA
jgi:hypothetical protein